MSYTYEQVTNLNNRARSVLDRSMRIRIKNHWPDPTVLGGCMVEYDDYYYKCTDTAPLGDIISAIENCERYVDNPGAFINML